MKRKLGAEPAQAGDRWRVELCDGSFELYHCQLDACRAQQQAFSDADLLLRLRDVKRLWCAELGKAAVSTAARLGHMSVDLSAVPVPCVPLLLEQACKR